MRLQYSLAFILIASVLGFFFFLEDVSGWLFLFLVEAILVFVFVELLHLHMPKNLREARSDNCLRMDGSISRNRLRQERRALNQMRRDLLAVFLIIVFSGNWLAFFVHYEIVPFPVAFKAAGAFDVDSQTWKENLRNARVDEAYADWSARRSTVDHAAIKSKQDVLWQTWPWVIMVFAGWAVACAMFLSRAYLKIIRNYAAGVAARAERNVNLDITRLQELHMT